MVGALDFETQAQYILTVTVTDDHLPALSDTADLGYHGPDSICYVLTDGQLDSEQAAITITVISNAPPGFDE